MSTTSAAEASRMGEATAYRPSAWHRVKTWLANRFAIISAIVVLLYLFVPVAYTFAFSFNDYRKSNIVWNSAAGPTLKHWKDPCGAPGVCEALVTSIQVGATRHRSSRRSSARCSRSRWCGTGSAAAPPATCSSSSRWPRPRSSSARAC